MKNHTDFPQLDITLKDYLMLSKNTRVTRGTKERYLSGESNPGQKPTKKGKHDQKSPPISQGLVPLHTPDFLTGQQPCQVRSLTLNTIPKHCLSALVKTVQSHRDCLEFQTSKLVNNNRKHLSWIIECLGDRTKLVGEDQKLLGLQQPSYYRLDRQMFSKLFKKELEGKTDDQKDSVFQAFKLVQDEYVYWPVAVLQPLNFDNMKQISQELLVKKCRDDRVKVTFDLVSKNENQSSPAAQLSEPQDNQVPSKLPDQKQADVPSGNGQSPIEPEDSPRLAEHHSPKEDNEVPLDIAEPTEGQTNRNTPVLCGTQEMRPKTSQPTQDSSEVLVWVMGTNVYRILPTSDLIHFNQIVPQQADRIFSQTRLSAVLEDIVQCVNLVNTSYRRYNNCDLKHEDRKLYIRRLAKMKKPDTSVYILLRHKHAKDSRQVLILDLNSGAISWQSPQVMTVSYFYPQFSRRQMKILFLLPQIPYQSLLTYLRNQKLDYDSVFGQLLEKKPEAEQPKLTRCAKCNYRISSEFEKSMKCFYCHKSYHNDCDDENRVFSFSDDALKTYWCCYSCVPCAVCFMKIEKEHLVECITCQTHFHAVCGMNKKSAAKFECEDCLKCDLCQKKLSNCSDQCFLEDDNVYCQSCVKLIGKGDYCKVCKGTQKHQSKSQWIKCDSCSGWIHKHCDWTLRTNYKYFTQPKVEYYCPFCRDQLRRSHITQMIGILIKFDDFGYFTQPVPETLLDYKDIITSPMCFSQMLRKCTEGQYDQNSEAGVRGDVRLIVSNAMQYNMPKDHCHYSARVLNVMSQVFFQFFREYFQIDDLRLVANKQFKSSISQSEKKLFRHINEHYLGIILNYRATNSTVHVKLNKGTGFNESSNMLVFRSRWLLNNFKNSQISISFKKDLPQISHLFSLPKLFEPSKLPITKPVCYYHNTFDVVFSCEVCLESFCCIKQCILHKRCSKCGQFGCCCDNWGCGCSPGYTNKELDHPSLREYNKDLMTITQMFKYCIKCSINNISDRLCKYCHKICSYSYQTCRQCHKRHHTQCRTKPVVVPGLCLQCERLPSNNLKYKQNLYLDNMIISNRLIKIQRMLPVLSCFYLSQGINISPSQIRQLLFRNYDRVQEYYDQFELYTNDYQTVMELNIQEQKGGLQQRAIQNEIDILRSSLDQLELIEINHLGLSLKCQQQLCKRVIFDLHFTEMHSEGYFSLSCRMDQCFSKYLAARFISTQDMDQELPELPLLAVSLVPALQFSRVLCKLVLLSKHFQSLLCCCNVKNTNMESTLSKAYMGRVQNRKKLRVVKQVIRGVLIDIYNQLKTFSRVGSTCLISLKKQSIEVYKKWSKGPGYWIGLQRQDNQWLLKINDKTRVLVFFSELVGSIRDLCGPMSRIETLEDVARFMGFNIFQDEQDQYTYTKFLQTHPMESGDRRPMVLEAYNSLKIPKVRREELFFLKKKSDGKHKPQGKPYTPPYFSFDELRRQLEDQPFVERNQFKRTEPTRQIFIAPSTIHKLGLFSTRLQKKNTVLIEYMGQILSEPMADLRESQYHLGCYMFAIPKKIDENFKTNDDSTYDSSTPHMANCKRDVIDATFRGNQARYLNHSCDPNCASLIQEIDGSPRILIYAIRDIQPFEQLTYDYQFKVTAGQKIVCTCKAKNCQGRLN